MILKDAYRNVCQCRIFVRFCHAKRDPVTPKYGYTMSDDGHAKRKKDTEGVLHVGKVDLPSKLNDSLKTFYERYSRKQIINDGLKLSKHIANRGRPSHATWERYKREVDSTARRTGRKGRDRDEVKKFALDEAIKEGVLPEEEIEELIKEAIVEEETGNEVEERDFPDDERVKEVKRKHVMRRPELAAYSMVRYGARETAAFAACQLPAVYGATFKALQEIKKREPNYEPATLLDFGSGTGMTVWAANALWRRSIREYQCVDPSEHMNRAAEFLLRGSSDIKKPAKIPYVYFKQFLPLSNQIKYDIVVAAYTLTEMPFQKQRLQAIQSLWRKTKDFLVIIEPGNNEGFETALQARRLIAAKDKEKEAEFDYSYYEDFFTDSCLDDGDEDVGHIFAPCTHELVCARNDVNTRDHPCNFTQKVELSFAYKSLKSFVRHGYYNERFSYIILRKGESTISEEEPRGWARILDPVKARRNHLLCELCCHNGNIEKHVLTKRKDPDIYKAARHFLKWGDMLPIDKARRPMNIRPTPSCKKGK